MRIDQILQQSGLDRDFIELSMEQRGFDPDEHSARQIDKFGRTATLPAKPTGNLFSSERKSP